MKTKKMSALHEVHIRIEGKHVVAWEAKEVALRPLGRWTDPKALLRRIYEFQHPEETQADGPGRQWQATWRGRYSAKPRKAA